MFCRTDEYKPESQDRLQDTGIRLVLSFICFTALAVSEVHLSSLKMTLRVLNFLQK